MFNFLAIFLIFLYFKIARVHKKEERLNNLIILEHIVVAISAIIIFKHAFYTQSIIVVGIESFISFILAALFVTSILLGIFIDGKPVFGISKVYKYLPFLTLLIVIFALFSI